MEVLLGLALWVVLAVVLLLPPLVQKDVKSLSETWPVLEWWPAESAKKQTTAQAETASAATAGGRPMTDGGRVCHNCGCYVEGNYLYCAECLMPKC
jgi:hypothetical protein